MATAFQFDPIAPMLRAIPSLPRPMLARLTEKLIERLDEIDGDPDLELAGDEMDGTCGEDDFHSQNASWTGAPGCPLADPGEPEDDRCAAGDDMIRSGPVMRSYYDVERLGREIGDEGDAEQECRRKPVYGINQALGPESGAPPNKAARAWNGCPTDS